MTAQQTGRKSIVLVTTADTDILTADRSVSGLDLAGFPRVLAYNPVALEDDTVVLSFRYPYHKEKIEETENRKVVAGLSGDPPSTSGPPRSARTDSSATTAA